MKYTRKRMLDSFEQLEIELEGSLGNMKIYHSMSDKELAELHREMFDNMYEDDYNYEVKFEYCEFANQIEMTVVSNGQIIFYEVVTDKVERVMGDFLQGRRF